MRRWTLTVWILLMLVSVLQWGCESLRPSEEPNWTRASIGDVAEVAGRWEGLMTSAPAAHHLTGDDWVRATIGPDGAYEFASYRMIGVFSGKGTAALENGDLVSRTDRGRILCSLYVAGGRRMLRVTGVTGDGVELSARLMPVR